jgi:hypothetical protein
MKKSKLTKSTLIAISMAASFAISSSSYAVVLSNNPSESQIGALIGSDKCGIDLNFDDAAGGRYIVGDTRENDLLEDSFGRTFAIVNKDKLGLQPN